MIKNKLGILKNILGLIIPIFLVYVCLEYVIYLVSEVTHKSSIEISASDYSFIRNEIQCSDDEFDKKKMINEAMSDNKIVGYEYLKIKNAHLVCLYKQNKLWWTIGYTKYQTTINEEVNLKEEKSKMKRILKEEIKNN